MSDILGFMCCGYPRLRGLPKVPLVMKYSIPSGLIRFLKEPHFVGLRVANAGSIVGVVGIRLPLFKVQVATKRGALRLLTHTFKLVLSVPLLA